MRQPQEMRGLQRKNQPVVIKMESFVTNQLEKELEHNITQQTKITDEIGEIESVQNNLKLIAEQPERPNTFIPINSLSYVPASIIHTGEQYIALGNVGQILMTTQETLAFLQRKIDSLNDSLGLFKLENTRLQKRKEIYLSESYEIPEDTADLPAEIVSDCGSAYKTGTGVFEIIEPYREEERKPVKSTKKLEEAEETIIKDDNWYMKRLEELEQEENGRGRGDKIISVTQESGGENVTTVFNKVKTIIKECGLYESLSKDLDITKFCDQGTGEDNNISLNSLIVKALLSEPASVLKYSDDDLVHNFAANVSINDLKASAYLDSIENDL